MPPDGNATEKGHRGGNLLQGFGRVGIARSEADVAPVNRGERKNRFTFDPSAGRDYAADAPVDLSKKPPSAKNSEKEIKVPIKSPAEVAAEKAAEWKRAQLEAENKKKEGKSYVKRKVMETAEAKGDFVFSRLEEELQALAA